MIDSYRVGDRVVIDNINNDDRAYIRSVLEASVGQKGEVVYVNSKESYLIVKFDKKVGDFGQMAYNFNEVRNV